MTSFRFPFFRFAIQVGQHSYNWEALIDTGFDGGFAVSPLLLEDVGRDVLVVGPGHLDFSFDPIGGGVGRVQVNRSVDVRYDRRVVVQRQLRPCCHVVEEVRVVGRDHDGVGEIAGP